MSRTIALITGASSGMDALDSSRPTVWVPGLQARSAALDVLLAAALLTGGNHPVPAACHQPATR
ncbi:hypothetical protein E1193_10495 [Micromonospora sp. KC606]|uniref:hypothetical protein n=1 Tax=Micromonospora sp. KC606 TaxID=2530379 RepID=UPI001049C1D0|nr:hypothetical protein [Micromonospora sp. KC606]TDC82879.1 hypothetical protein E1193_10495 [Micromonospora sp. KC606]